MARRRANNEGSIHKLPSGAWRAQLRLDGQRLSYTGKTQRECQEWVKKTIGQIDEGLTFANTKVTLAEFMENWLTSTKASQRPRTWSQYSQLNRDYIAPRLGTIKVKDLRAEHIQRLYNSLGEQDTGTHTILKIHMLLHSALEHAIRTGMIPRNPVDATIPPAQPAEEMQILDESQVSQLLVAAANTRLEALLHLALATGMRQMELLGLKWTDLDWVRKTIKVERQLVRPYKESKLKFATPKTKAGRRTLNLGQKTIEVLRSHAERQRQERLALGDKWENNGLIFTNSLGGPYDPRNLLRDYKKLLKVAGLPDMRFHDLRHTAASLMLNHGVAVIVVSRRLGHARASITLDVYGHLIPSMQEEAADLIDELITPVPFNPPVKKKSNLEEDNNGL